MLSSRTRYRLQYKLGNMCSRVEEYFFNFSPSFRTVAQPFLIVLTPFALGVILGVLNQPYYGVFIALSLILCAVLLLTVLATLFIVSVSMVYSDKMKKQKRAIHKALVDVKGIRPGDTSYYFSLMPDWLATEIDDWVSVPTSLSRKILFLLAGYTPEMAGTVESDTATVEDMQVYAALQGRSTDLAGDRLAKYMTGV